MHRRHRRMTLTRALVAAVVALPLAGHTTPAHAAPGDLDRTFFGGAVVTDASGNLGHDWADDVVIQPDGKVVAAGFVEIEQGNRAFAVVRYGADGVPDRTFGGDGVVITDAASGRDELRALQLQPDGMILAAGFSQRQVGDYDFAVVRYRPDGSLDPGFGKGGLVRTNVSATRQDDAAFSLRLQPDGRIIVGGTTYGQDGDFALVRYLPDGSLDPGFDGDGKVTTSFGDGPWDELLSTAQQPDGKLVVAGLSFSGDPCGEDCFDWVLARYQADGSLDPGFGVGGMVRTDFEAGAELAHAVDVQPADGKIVVAGDSRRRIPGTSLDEHRLALARYLPDGSLDPQFGQGGTVVTGGLGSVSGGEDVAVQPDGRIVVASGSGGDFAVVRYDGDGALDSSFGGDGIATTDFNERTDRAHALAVQPDGRIVVAGESRSRSAATSFDSSSFDFAVARYQGGPCAGWAATNVVIGTGGDDVLVGTPGNDMIVGFSGHDRIDGLGGADCIDSGPGDDTVDAGKGDDRVVGGPGRDQITGRAGNDGVVVNAGDVPPGATETVDGGALPGSDSLRLERGMGTDHVVGAPPAFTVVDPATGGTYSVTDVERIKDTS